MFTLPANEVKKWKEKSQQALATFPFKTENKLPPIRRHLKIKLCPC